MPLPAAQRRARRQAKVRRMRDLRQLINFARVNGLADETVQDLQQSVRVIEVQLGLRNRVPVPVLDDQTVPDHQQFSTATPGNDQGGIHEDRDLSNDGQSSVAFPMPNDQDVVNEDSDSSNDGQ